MSYKHKPTVIESLAEKLGVIADLHADEKSPVAGLPSEGVAVACPPPEKWDSWVEYDSKSWPERKANEYMLIPTACFNCEAGCGLLAYVDKKTMKIRKLVGNPYHPASRGRNCAKGPATLNQVEDQDRVLYPMKRVGERGAGNWQRVSWDSVLDDISGRMRKAIMEGRNNEISYHVGRPGHDGFMEWVFKAGMLMVTTATPMYAPQVHGLATPSGKGLTAHPPTTPMPGSFFLSAPTLSRVITSTPTRSVSLKHA